MTDDTPVTIVGAGLAGLFCALKLAPRPVTVLAAAPLGDGASSAWAQGGIAAAVSELDTPDAHVRDTVAAGAGIVDARIATIMASEARARRPPAKPKLSKMSLNSEPRSPSNPGPPPTPDGTEPKRS